MNTLILLSKYQSFIILAFSLSRLRKMTINFLITQGEFLTTFCEFMNHILLFKNNYFCRVDLINSFFDTAK